MMTVTYLSPRLVCRHTCSSTPMTLTPSNRVGSSISSRCPFSEDRGVRGVPGHGEFACDHGHGVVVDDEGTQRPVEAGSRDLRSWWRRSSGVLTPYQAALDTFVTAEANMKRGRSVTEGFVGQTADDGIPNDPVPTTPSAPVIGSVRPAFQDGFVPGDVLADTGQGEGVESAKCREVWGRESRLGHVEVFRMDCVRTSIIGRPRRLSRQRLAVSWNHRPTPSITKSLVTGNDEDPSTWVTRQPVQQLYPGNHCADRTA